MKLSIDASIRRVPFYPKAALYGADAGWVRLSSNENPYPPSPAVMEAMADALFDVNRYPESEAELNSLLAKKYGLSPENIIIGNGSNEMIETACRALRTAGRTEVLISEPSFAFYRIAAGIYGYEVAAAPLDSSAHRPSAHGGDGQRENAASSSSATPTTLRARSSRTGPSAPSSTSSRRRRSSSWTRRMRNFRTISFPPVHQLYRPAPRPDHADLLEGLRACRPARRLRHSGKVARLLPGADETTLQRQHDGPHRGKGRLERRKPPGLCPGKHPEREEIPLRIP